MDKIEPARPLVLTRDQHALLGELVEIVGQIEGMLIQSAEKIDAVASAKLKGLTATPQAKLWAEMVGAPVSNSELSTLILAARDELIRLAEDRNDFIHALYKGELSLRHFGLVLFIPWRVGAEESGAAKNGFGAATLSGRVNLLCHPRARASFS
jgi:hypothetical protein